MAAMPWRHRGGAVGNSPTEGPAGASQVQDHSQWKDEQFSALHDTAGISLEPPPSFPACNKGSFTGRGIPNSQAENLCIQCLEEGGKIITLHLSQLLRVLSDCLVSFQMKASSHYRNCHIIRLFMLPLRYGISFLMRHLYFLQLLGNTPQ